MNQLQKGIGIVVDRRSFLKKAVLATAGITLAPLVPKVIPESAVTILKTKDFIEFVPYEPSYLYDVWDKKFTYKGVDLPPILFYANICIEHKGERMRMDLLF